MLFLNLCTLLLLFVNLLLFCKGLVVNVDQNDLMMFDRVYIDAHCNNPGRNVICSNTSGRREGCRGHSTVGFYSVYDVTNYRSYESTLYGNHDWNRCFCSSRGTAPTIVSLPDCPRNVFYIDMVTRSKTYKCECVCYQTDNNSQYSLVYNYKAPNV
jgi:hypothetical protein